MPCHAVAVQGMERLRDAFSESRLYCGGFRAQQVITLLHGQRRVEGSTEVVPGVYIGGHEAAVAEVATGGLLQVGLGCQCVCVCAGGVGPARSGQAARDACSRMPTCSHGSGPALHTCHVIHPALLPSPPLSFSLPCSLTFASLPAALPGSRGSSRRRWRAALGTPPPAAARWCSSSACSCRCRCGGSPCACWAASMPRRRGSSSGMTRAATRTDPFVQRTATAHAVRLRRLLGALAAAHYRPPAIPAGQPTVFYIDLLLLLLLLPLPSAPAWCAIADLCV